MTQMATAELKEEYLSVEAQAGLAEPEVSVVRVSGRDRVKWLHKLVTADVEDLSAGQGVRSALLDAKGHFVADFVLLALEDSFLLLVDPGPEAMLLHALRRYIIREKVQLQDESAQWQAFAVVGKRTDEIVKQQLGELSPPRPYYWTAVAAGDKSLILTRRPRAPFPSIDLLVPAALAGSVRASLADLRPLSAGLLEVLRVEAGLPRWGAELGPDVLALEIPQVMQIRVDQGCYVGQEVVARIVHRGHVNRHLVGLTFRQGELPRPGAVISQSGNPVGQVTSSVVSPILGPIGLGFVRREFSEPGTELQVEGVAANVEKLPFRGESSPDDSKPRTD